MLKHYVLPTWCISVFPIVVPAKTVNIIGIYILVVDSQYFPVKYQINVYNSVALVREHTIPSEANRYLKVNSVPGGYPVPLGE